MGQTTPEIERIQGLRDAIAVIAIDNRALILSKDTDEISPSADDAAKQDTLDAAMKAWREGYLVGSWEEIEQVVRDVLGYS